VPGLAQAQQNGSGGAGGSIWLSAQTLGGSGEVDASGGAAGPGIGGAGGGGGRVAITWESDAASAFDSDAIDAHGGAADTSFGGPGTIFLAPPAGVQRLIVDNADLVNPNEIAPWPEVGLRTVSSAQSDRVTVTNAGWIPGAYVGLDAVLGSGATRYTIVSNTEDTLVFQAADGNVSGFGGAALRAYFVLEGALEVHGGSRVGLVDRLAATSLLIDGGAVVTHPPTVANAPEHGVWIETSGALTIAADGRIDVSVRGFRGDCQTGAAACGSGATWFGNVGDGSKRSAGGSFGGLGGGPNPNPLYGDALLTWIAGAGGGYGNGAGEPGGAGGGRVRLIVGGLALAGSVLADGGDGSGANAGGGAGGGIWITASQVTGAGAIEARGGDGHTNGGGGGGGRVHIDAPGAAGISDVGGGTSQDVARNGADGTSVRD